MLPGSELFSEQNMKRYRRAHRVFFHRSGASRAGARAGLFVFFSLATLTIAGMSGKLSIFYHFIYIIEAFIAFGILRKM
jgi:type IV secretory pathway TrbF-like protein